MTGSYFDIFAFAFLPYLAVVVFLFGTIRRYRMAAFSYSSLSSQFLENQRHFWSLVPFHYGLLAILAGHVIGFAIPRTVLAWNSVPMRLYILELAALIFGVLTLIGLVQIIFRRLTDAKVRFVTSAMDWVLYFLLLAQVIAGLYTAVFHGWGSSWFAAAAAPYLWSLVEFRPDLTYVVAMPISVKLHMAGALLVFVVFPYTRLVHLLVFPTPYLWRSPQVVRWYGRGRADAATGNGNADTGAKSTRPVAGGAA